MPNLPDQPEARAGGGAAAVGIQITVDVKPGNREEFLQAMETLRSRDTLPCDEASSGLFEDRKHRNRFLVLEHWRHPAQLDECLGSERFRAMIGALRVLGTIQHIYGHSAVSLVYEFASGERAR